jgi:hypothetical protein
MFLPWNGLAYKEDRLGRTAGVFTLKIVFKQVSMLLNFFSTL